MLPSVVMDTSAIEWPTQRNSNPGPYEANGYYFGFSPDYSGLKLRAHASGDNGHTWSEQDAGNAPAIPSSTLKHLSVDSSGDTFYICMPGSTTTCNIHVFNASTLTWGTTLVGPTINWSTAGNGQTVCWYFYRSGVHVIAAQVLPEATWRRCALFYGTPGAWTGPLYLSTGTSSLPGSVTHHDLMYAIYGASDRFHLFWTDGTTTANALMTRAFTSTNTFGTTVNLNTQLSILLNPAQFPFGIGCRYEDSGVHLGLIYGRNSTFLLRVDSLTSDTAASWTQDVVAIGGASHLTSNPGVVMSDGGRKLFMVRVFDTTLKTLQLTDDGGTGTWSDVADWKPENFLEIYGISARLMGDRIGLFYCDTGIGASLKYDQLHIYQSKVSQGVGTVTTEQDLGVGGVPDYLIFKDDSAASGISSTIEVRMREDEGVLWGDPLITLGTDSSDSRDIANTGQTARFIQITETIAGGSMESGVAGT